MSSKIINFSKMSMHKRPTYETLVKNTILEPKDRISLPDRLATRLRNTQQLSMWDDPSFINLDDEQQKIIQDQIRQRELLKISQSPQGKGLPPATSSQQLLTMKVQKALSEGSKPKDTSVLVPISKITQGTASSSIKPAETFVIGDADDHLLERQRELEEDLETAQLLAEEKKQEAIKQTEEKLKTKTLVEEYRKNLYKTSEEKLKTKKLVDEYIENLYKTAEEQERTARKTKEKTSKSDIGPLGTVPFSPATSTSQEELTKKRTVRTRTASRDPRTETASASASAAQEDTPESSRPLPSERKTKRSAGRPSKEQISPEISRPRSTSRAPFSQQAAAAFSGEEIVPPHRLDAVIADLNEAVKNNKLTKEEKDYFYLLTKKPRNTNTIKEMKSLWSKIIPNK